MAIVDGLACAVGEVAAHLAGRVVGRTFKFDRDKAQRIGEYIVGGALLAAGVLVTVVYT
jgi:hypothetical protein